MRAGDDVVLPVAGLERLDPDHAVGSMRGAMRRDRPLCAPVPASTKRRSSPPQSLLGPRGEETWAGS